MLDGSIDITTQVTGYQTGTFNVTATPSTSGSITLNDNTLSYTKVGGLVFVTGNLNISSLSSPVGAIHIGNLPYATSVDAIGKVNFQGMSSDNIELTGWLLSGSDGAILKIYDNEGIQPSADAANKLLANTTIRVSITYMTA